MRRKKKKEEVDTSPVGGLPFFISLFCLLLLATVNLITLPSLIDTRAYYNWRWFIFGVIIGAMAAGTLIQGKLKVFIHEFKHSVVSRLAGNKEKRMKFRNRSGYYQYSYTQQTKKYNALISLAPYFLPLFTIFSLLLMFVPQLSENPNTLLLLVGIAYGGDLVLNVRDISPVQTDITEITGGYTMGLLFILAMNITIFTFLAAWVSQGLFGLKALVIVLWEFMVHMFVYYRGL
jgi:hypothetical protein